MNTKIKNMMSFIVTLLNKTYNLFSWPFVFVYTVLLNFTRFLSMKIRETGISDARMIGDYAGWFVMFAYGVWYAWWVNVDAYIVGYAITLFISFIYFQAKDLAVLARKVNFKFTFIIVAVAILGFVIYFLEDFQSLVYNSASFLILAKKAFPFRKKKKQKMELASNAGSGVAGWIFGGTYVTAYAWFMGLDFFIFAYAIAFITFYSREEFRIGIGLVNWWWLALSVLIVAFLIFWLFCFIKIAFTYFEGFELLMHATTGDDGSSYVQRAFNIAFMEDDSGAKSAITEGKSAISNTDAKEGYKIKLELEVDKTTGDSIKKTVTNVALKTIEKFGMELASNAGIGTAVGAVGAAILKSNLPPMQKLAMLGGSSAITAAGLKLGTNSAEALIIATGATAYRDIEADQIPSPVDPFINSFLDKSELSSPLQVLLEVQFYISILLFCLIVLFLYLLFTKLFSKYTSATVQNIVIKNMDQRSMNTNNAKSFFNFTGKMSDKFFYFMFILLTLNIIFLIFLSFVISFELTTNLDIYLKSHNEYYKNIY